MRITQTQRDEAVALAEQIGAAEAARRLGLNANTVRSWMARAPQHQANAEQRAQTTHATQARLATAAERKAQLASDLLDDAQRLRAQLFAPCTERKALVVSHGQNLGSEVDIAEIHHDQPPFADQRQIMTSIAIAVDKIQILTGEATQRIEQLTAGTEPVERRQRATGVVDELAARRAG